MAAEDLNQLMSRVALGDRAAFRRLYDATSAKLFGVCLRLMKNRQEAEDVLQECYVKIWNNAGKFQASGYSPVSWLVAVARNQAIDRLRAKRPDAVPLDEAEEISDQSYTPEQLWLAASDASRLKRCLEGLQPDRAAAVKAAYLEGYSYQELAVRHGLPLNTVRTWLRRSLMSLKDCLSR